MDVAAVDRLVSIFFGGPSPQYGPYLPPGSSQLAERREVVVNDTLLRYRLIDNDSRPVVLQVYLDISNHGGLMWEQDVRVLLRASAIRHPALPEIIDGGHENGASLREAGFDLSGFAFVVTRGSLYDLAGLDGATDYFMAHPIERLRHFTQLTEAVGILHDHGLIHRNIWPGCIDVEQRDGDSGALNLLLTRFEMSTLFANLLRSATIDATRGSHRVRDLLLGQRNAGRALAYFPPERIEFLYPDGDGVGDLDDQRSDIYSLGVVVWEWFFGPLGDEPPEDLNDSESVRRWARAVHDRLHERVAAERQLPRRLCDLLASMLAVNPAKRPRAAKVISALTDNYAGLVAHFTGETSELPYLVAYMPKESIPTVYEWKWIRSSPISSEGRAELSAFLEDELRDAVLVDSPYGAAPFIEGGGSEAKREARHVLLGERAAWFCQRFRASNPLGVPTGPPVDEVMLIKYVVPLDNARARGILNLRDRSRFKQTVQPIEAFAHDIHPQQLLLKIAGRPSWSPLLEATRTPTAIMAHELAFEQALEWLLEYQGVQLRSREYAYELLPGSTPRQVKLTFDSERDLERLHTSPLLAKYASNTRRRPSFVDFFTLLADTSEDETLKLEIVADERGRPADRVYSAKARFVGTADSSTLVVSLDNSGLPPERGWVRPEEDIGSRVALRRQTDARWELLDERVLLDQLNNPTSIPGFPDRWERVIDDLPGKKLEGEGRSIVLDMLVSQPFFALQGPPGTGKTEVASRAAAAFLRSERGSRVLVSAQANYALDNLAQRLLQRLGVLDDNGRMKFQRDLIPLRVVSPSTDHVQNTVMQQFTLADLAPARRDQIADEVRDDLKRSTDGWTEIRQSYVEVLEDALPELSDRFLRGANLVFATCLAATRRALATSDTSLFDWVLIEEAAKAWPGELAIPLAQGLRWALLGDHKQLPAHRRDEVVQFLEECGSDENPEISLHGKRAAEYAKVFGLFAELFSRTRVEKRGGMAVPTRMLRQQFRMRAPIGELVSRVFYPATDAPWNGGPLPPGELENLGNVAPHGITTIPWLVNQDLIWLDTADVPDCVNEGSWRNEGEARIVAELLRRMRVDVEKRVMVLTPYREQVRVLKRADAVRGRASTIPAFQGREADIVVVSLVRDRVRMPGVALSNIGYLIQPELINVMVSRARQLLVIVGDFGHFREVGGFWTRLCAGVEQFGKRERAGKVYEA